MTIFSSFCCQKEERFLIVWDSQISNNYIMLCRTSEIDTLYGFFGGYVVINYPKYFERVDTAIISIIREHIANRILYSDIRIGVSMVEYSGKKIQDEERYIYNEKRKVAEYFWSINNPYVINLELITEDKNKKIEIPFEYSFGKGYDEIISYIHANNIEIQCEELNDFLRTAPQYSFKRLYRYDE